MRIRSGVLVAAFLTTACLVGSPAASAATEVGDNCAANDVAEVGFGIFEVSAPFNPLPTSAPAAGVVTSWKSTSAVPAPFPLGHAMKVVRPLGPTAVQIVGESTGSIANGANSFDTRIPIQAGDRIALVAANQFGVILICEAPGQPGAIGIFPGTATTGQTVPSAQGPAELRIPVSAVVEPDADNDGFGDETQDRCPQSAALQTACPVTVLDSFPLAKRGKVVVLVATSETAAVTVTGSAKFPTRKGARSSAQAKLPKLTKVVPAGKITRFALNLPAKLRSAVAALPKGKSITVKLAATVPNLGGPAAIDRTKVKLKR